MLKERITIKILNGRGVRGERQSKRMRTKMRTRKEESEGGRRGHEG